MKRALFVLAVCAVLTGPVMAVPSLYWNRGENGSTYQLWTFDDNDNPAAPEIDENPYGTAEATIDGGYADHFVGMDGVWGNHPDPVEIALFIPNAQVRNPYKDIVIEMCYKGVVTGVSVSPAGNPDMSTNFVLAEDPVLVDPINLWYIARYKIRIFPNPDAEIIYISATGTGGFIDYISVDTICIPAPGAILLGGIGIGAIGWLRRRRIV
ncbi:MAG: hypothetical protein ACYS8Z_12240 [Planctomycetota bacterium]